MATFSSGVKCFRSFLIRSLRYLNGGTLSPVPTEAGQKLFALTSCPIGPDIPAVPGILLHTCELLRVETVFSLAATGGEEEIFGKLVLPSLQSGTRDRTQISCGVYVRADRRD